VAQLKISSQVVFNPISLAFRILLPFSSSYIGPHHQGAQESPGGRFNCTPMNRIPSGALCTIFDFKPSSQRTFVADALCGLHEAETSSTFGRGQHSPQPTCRRLPGLLHGQIHPLHNTDNEHTYQGTFWYDGA